MDERVIFAAAIRIPIVVFAAANLWLARAERRRYRDVRAFRGLVAAVTMLGGAVAFGAGSVVIYEALGRPFYIPVLTGAGVMVFLAGIVFSCFSWRAGR